MVRSLLEKAKSIAGRSMPPKGADNCEDCLRLDRLAPFAKDFSTHKDSASFWQDVESYRLFHEVSRDSAMAIVRYEYVASALKRAAALSRLEKEEELDE